MMQGWEHLVIALCISYILHHIVSKSKKAKALDERLHRLETQVGDWDDYLAKLCRITGKNAHELMTIAAQESGLNYSGGTGLVKILGRSYMMVNFLTM